MATAAGGRVPAAMNGLDWVILAVIVVSGAISVIRGFVKEAISLATWLLAFWVALVFAAKLSLLMPAALESPTARWIAAAVVLFMATLLVGGLANFLVSSLVEKTGLTGTDRALGVVFGLLRGVVIVALVLVIARGTTVGRADWWADSRLRPFFDPVAGWMQAHYPAEMAESLLGGSGGPE